MTLQRNPHTARPNLKGAMLPVTLGAVLGLAVVAVNTDSGRVDVPEGAALPETVRVPEPTRIILPQVARSAETANGIWDLFLPARPAASDLTHRIENGLPLNDPEPPPKIGESREPPKVPAARVSRPRVAQYARQAENVPSGLPGSSRPAIAIIIDDMGFDGRNSARAVRLPPEVTLAYLPFAPSVSDQVRAARRRGHQIMLHLPMEANDIRAHPGRKVLSVANDEQTLRRRLALMLRSFSGYIGVNNHQGSRFTRDGDRMDIVLAELRRRGLFFVDSKTSGRSVGEAAAKRAAIPYASRDVFLDHDPDPHEIRARMAETERLARLTGQAIAIGHPRTATMDLMVPWIAGLADRGFRLARVSELLERPPIVYAAKELAQNTISE